MKSRVCIEGDEGRKRNVRIKGEIKEALHTLRQEVHPGNTYVSETQVLSDINDSMTSGRMHNPLPATQSQKDFVSKTHEDTLISIDFLTPKHAEYDESNTYVLERFNTSAGNPVKKILLKLNLSDHRLCKMVVECQRVKVKEFQERCNIKAFQEWYEHVGPEVASPQGGKVSKMAKRLCLVDDLKMLKITVVCPIVNASAGRLLGAYDLVIATPRVVVHAGDKTSGDARSWYMSHPQTGTRRKHMSGGVTS
ncbi:hypothetical protein Tco_1391319 [Tanacetum coccineum]